MFINITNEVYDVATNNTSCFLLNEASIRQIAEAMRANVHIGTGTGTFPVYSGSYTAPIGGTPFVEFGDYLFTINLRNGSKYIAILNKYNYSSIKSMQIGSSEALIVCYETSGIRSIGANSIGSASANFIFCTYTDVQGTTTPCLIIKTSSSAYINIHHGTSTSQQINLPSCDYSSQPDYVCIQQLAYNPKAAIFNGLYSAVCQHESNYKAVLLNGVTYDVLGSYSTSYPAIYVKRD